jgi:uncharacterized protein involved in exopolysaccharide biosynthesis
MRKQPKQMLALALLIIGLALLGYGLSLLLSPNEYCATTKIRVEPDHDDSFDPYFIQTTFEIIQSDVVLSNVVGSLNLNEELGKKFDNGKLFATDESINWLRRHLKFSPIRMTKMIAISFTSHDPDESAKVADAVANAYLEYRRETQEQFAGAGLKAMQDQYEYDEKQILLEQTDLERLRQKFGIQNSSSTNRTPAQQPYWDEKFKLNQLIEINKLLGSKIEAQKANKIPEDEDTLPQIVDLATPPHFPVPRDFALAISLIVAGLLSAIAGLFLLKSLNRGMKGN